MVVPPPIYVCEVCGYGLDPKGLGVLRLAKVWVRGASKTLYSVDHELYVYRHEVCMDKKLRKEQETLF